MQAMKCPNDGTEMVPVKIESHVGQTIVVDQCPECGGIWFDRSELYRARQGEADRIEMVNTDSLRAPSNVAATLHCPRDESPLARFEDKYFPTEIVVARCPACDGFWLNRGEFTRYQNLRFDRRNRAIEDKRLEEDIQRLLATNHPESTSEALTRIANFLSTPIDRQTLRPDSGIIVEEPGPPGSAVELVAGLLNVVLRLFILR